MKTAKKLSLAILATGVWSQTAHAAPVWVQVRESMVRSKPAFYSPGLAGIRYGDQLEKVSQEGGWVKVQVKKAEGFVPLSTLSTDRIVLSAKDVSRIKGDSTEVVLAGKGFSKEVEQEYKKSDTAARFDLVDKVERATNVSTKDVAEFVKKGDLKG